MSIGRANTDRPSANKSPKLTAMMSACSTSAEASSRLPAPSVRATAETTPPPIAPADICCSSSAKGSSTAQPASAAVPWRAASQVSTSCAPTCSSASSVVGAASAITCFSKARGGATAAASVAVMAGER